MVLTRAASSQRRQLWQQRTVPQRLVFLILLLPRFARLREKESVKPAEVAGAQDLRGVVAVAKYVSDDLQAAASNGVELAGDCSLRVLRKA